MKFTAYVFLISGGLFAGMLLLLEAGRRIGLRQVKKDPEGAHSGLGAIDGAVFALLGLLIAFTFSNASSRFDGRRVLITQETNAIGTAWLRIDLLSSATQPEMRERFRRYLDARLAIYKKLPDVDAAKAETAQAEAIQSEIWRLAISGSGEANAHPEAARLLLPSLNDMFDIATMRTVAAYTHAPWIMFVLLFGLAFVSALLAGYGTAVARRRRWLHTLSFAAAMAIAVYVILDLEYPRLGLIRVDDFDQALVELRQKMQ